jgi:vanillate O-demethylase ferredoxin subunit
MINTPENRLQVRVRSVTWQAEGINAYDLRLLGGGELPAFEAGSHIDVHLPDGKIRQYSLSNDPAERHRYVIGVQREPEGRGGSKLWAETAQPGAVITISPPRNNFPLAKDARKHLLFAGGIGITPMMAMIRELERRDADFHLYYCTRGPERTAFRDELQEGPRAARVTLHHDGGDPSCSLDLGAVIHAAEPDTHVYFCGPTGFMDAAMAAAADLPRSCVHVEYFQNALPDAESQGIDSGEPFTVRILSTSEEYTVPPDKTIVEVLRENGIEIETSCESGLCRTCLTRYVSGTPEHFDLALDDEEHEEYVLPCCARSLSSVLVLDL